MTDSNTARSTPTSPQRKKGESDFLRIQKSDDFVRLRRRLLGFVFPMSTLFLCWYLGFVLLAAYAHEFMSQKVAGLLTVGLLLGVLQFMSTIAIVVVYLRFARTKLDPNVAKIRAQCGTWQHRGPVL